MSPAIKSRGRPSMILAIMVMAVFVWYGGFDTDDRYVELFYPDSVSVVKNCENGA